MVDLEGFGYSDGSRVNGLSIEKFENQVAAVLAHVDPKLPCFLMGHSMGGLTVNAFLGRNPNIASKLSGVVFSAPFFGMPKFAQKNFVEKTLV
jgi:alpha-beta hydrolase superfamily lysophospholipase